MWFLKTRGGRVKRVLDSAVEFVSWHGPRSIGFVKVRLEDGGKKLMLGTTKSYSWLTLNPLFYVYFSIVRLKR